MILLMSDLERTLHMGDVLKKIKSNFKKPSILFIPSTISNMEKTRKYISRTVTMLEAEGVEINSFGIYEGQNIELGEYGMIYLMGGSAKEQNAICRKIKEHLLAYQGVIVGLSAGALNLGKEVFLNPCHEESESVEYLEGIGAYEEYIDVHVDCNNELQMQVIANCGKKILCIEDTGCVLIENKKFQLYGDAYFWGDKSIDLRYIE